MRIHQVFQDDDLLMISSLQHALFCERQFALIHIEQLWCENLYTAEGAMLHERVHVPHHESRKRFLQEYSLPVRSDRFGLIGVCDLVELEFDSDKHILRTIPIEFKRGRSKPTHVDMVQLCAQAICLEEMLSVSVPLGQIYYLQERKRIDIPISLDLIEETNATILRCREIFSTGITPEAEFSSKKCQNCSLLDLCFPAYVGKQQKNVSTYIDNQINQSREGNME